MSFITTDKRLLARDLWPEGMGRPLKDVDDSSTLPPSRLVPAEYSELCQWLCVDTNDPDGQVKVLVNPEVCGGDDGLLEVTLRIQGFVQDVNLNTLGNWTGDADTAPKAVQTLRLIAGGYNTPFMPQVHALSNIRELVLKMLGKPTTSVVSTGGEILLKRRVFQKVRGGICGLSVLRRQDDPAGRAAKIDNMWRVTHRVDVGIQGGDGTVSRANPLIIRRGDFVDVAVAIQVHSMRSHKQRKTEVQFCPIEVVRLRTAKEVKKITIKQTKLTLDHPKDEVRRNTGFAFEGQIKQQMEMQTD